MVFALVAGVFLSSNLIANDFLCQWLIETPDEKCPESFATKEDLEQHVLNTHYDPQAKKCFWAKPKGYCGRNWENQGFETHMRGHLANYFGEVYEPKPKQKPAPQKTSPKKPAEQKKKKQPPKIEQPHIYPVGKLSDEEFKQVIEQQDDVVEAFEKAIFYGNEIPERQLFRVIEKYGFLFLITPSELLYYCDRCNWAFHKIGDYHDHNKLHAWWIRHLWLESDD